MFNQKSYTVLRLVWTRGLRSLLDTSFQNTDLKDQWLVQYSYQTLPFFQENKIKNLTDRLESTQHELQSLEGKFASQMAALWITTNSSTVQLNRLKNVWITVNTTAEKTSNLTSKVRDVL